MDKPLMTSLIRRELPKMDAEEFEELDDLSRGKLPQDSVTGNPGFHLHLQANCVICWSAHPADIPGQSRQVVGSFKESMFWWNQVETILTHEDGWKRWEG